MKMDLTRSPLRSPRLISSSADNHVLWSGTSLFSLRLSTMITINLRLQAIKTAFSEGGKRHALPPGAFDLSLSGDNSNTHPPYVKVRQLCIILMVLGVCLRLKWRSQSKMSHEKRPQHLPAD